MSVSSFWRPIIIERMTAHLPPERTTIPVSSLSQFYRKHHGSFFYDTDAFMDDASNVTAEQELRLGYLNVKWTDNKLSLREADPNLIRAFLLALSRAKVHFAVVLLAGHLVIDIEPPAGRAHTFEQAKTVVSMAVARKRKQKNLTADKAVYLQVDFKGLEDTGAMARFISLVLVPESKLAAADLRADEPKAYIAANFERTIAGTVEGGKTRYWEHLVHLCDLLTFGKKGIHHILEFSVPGASWSMARHGTGTNMPNNEATLDMLVIWLPRLIRMGLIIYIDSDAIEITTKKDRPEGAKAVRTQAQLVTGWPFYKSKEVSINVNKVGCTAPFRKKLHLATLQHLLVPYISVSHKGPLRARWTTYIRSEDLAV
jgi:hypothetical protein